MPADIKFYIPVIVIFTVAVLLFIITLYIKKTRKKADERIISSFGQIPQDDKADIEAISSYHSYRSKNTKSSGAIDDTTWNDLNMDDVFGRMDICSCSVGEEYLYHLLHELKSQSSDLEKRELLIGYLTNEPEKRLQIQKILLGIGKMKNNCLSYYLFHADQKVLRLRWLFTVMACLPAAGIIIMPVSITAGGLIALCSIVVNVITYYITHMTLENELSSIKYFSALLHGAKKLEKHFGKKLCKLGYELPCAIKPFERLGGLISGKSQQSLAEAEIFIVIFKAVFLVDLLIYNKIIHTMNAHRAELNMLFEIVGEMDAAIAIASFRQSLPFYCVPEFQKQNALDFTDMYHPLILNPVANSAKIANGSVITGSNASGKSTFIKAVAVNCILAQTVLTCCARRFNLSFCYIATSMALRDDILAGESYFVTEIKSLSRIISYCKTRVCVVFIDEILRGTNTPERLAASAAVLKRLKATGSLCIVASHDIELTRLLAGIYDNYHFSEQLAQNLVAFDYLLKPGPSCSTNAIKLLKYMGFDSEIVDEAERLAGQGGA